jgi:hypothetical protein
MSAHEPDINRWTDPKDYGLPFVKIVPIKAKEEPEIAALDIDSKHPEAVVSQSPAEKISERVKPVEIDSAMAEPVVIADSQRTSANTPSDTPDKKQASGWMWAVLLIALGIVGVIVWQILGRTNDTKGEPVFEIVEKPMAQPAITNTEPDQSTIAEENQDAVNQDPIQVDSNSNSNISKPAENGTTIANTATGNLIRVESKSERAQYFIIVGSLPNERLALKEANQYYGRTAELYLLSPIDGGKNYRLALSKFDSFKMAAARLEEIKSQYTEELWILKY